jgi:transcriptional regulator with XRE-family HTH domain
VKKIIGNRIRKLRLSKEYSQQNMADELNITSSAYSKIERGVTDTSISRLEAIAEILGVKPIYFYQEQSPIAHSQAEEQHKDIGYASKSDVEELTSLVRKIQREIASLKASLQTTAKPAKKKA